MWKQAISVWRKTSGVWTEGTIPHIKISGVWKRCFADPLIETDKNTITASYQFREYTDYVAINVTPNTMSTTITLVDTGDGTDWVISQHPAIGVGDYNMRVRCDENISGSPARSCIARISDNDSIIHKDITVTQIANP